LNILIIDDDATDYRSFRKRYGGLHNIEQEPDPELGINRIRKGGWDVVLVDLDFGNGYNYGITNVVPRAMKAVGGQCPVIVVTNDVNPSAPRTVRQHGVRAFMQKGNMTDEGLMALVRKR